MFEKFGELVRRKFCSYADERWRRSCAHSAVTVAGIAGLCFEDSLPFCSQRISERHIRCGQRCRRELGLKWLASVFVFFGFLLGQLRSHSRSVSIQILAAQAESQ